MVRWRWMGRGGLAVQVLQDKRFKNRELLIMRMLVKKEHPNIVRLKHCFYSNGDKVRWWCACRFLQRS